MGPSRTERKRERKAYRTLRVVLPCLSPCAATMTTRQEEDVAADATPGPEGQMPNGPPKDQSPPASPQGELYSPAAGEWEEYARRGQAAHSEPLRKG